MPATGILVRVRREAFECTVTNRLTVLSEARVDRLEAASSPPRSFASFTAAVPKFPRGSDSVATDARVRRFGIVIELYSATIATTQSLMSRLPLVPMGPRTADRERDEMRDFCVCGCLWFVGVFAVGTHARCVGSLWK